MSSEITVFFVGNLGRNAEMKYLQDGTALLNFSVAANVGFGQNKETQWTSCTLWGKRAEALAQYLTKGTKVSIVGTLSRAINPDNTYFNVNVSNITLLGGGSESQAPNEPEETDQVVYANDEEDDIPF